MRLATVLILGITAGLIGAMAREFTSIAGGFVVSTVTALALCWLFRRRLA